MDYSSLPQYRGEDDDPPIEKRESFDRTSLGASFGIVLAAVLALVTGTAITAWVVLRLGVVGPPG